MEEIKQNNENKWKKRWPFILLAIGMAAIFVTILTLTIVGHSGINYHGSGEFNAERTIISTEDHDNEIYLHYINDSNNYELKDYKTYQEAIGTEDETNFLLMVDIPSITINVEWKTTDKKNKKIEFNFHSLAANIHDLIPDDDFSSKDIGFNYELNNWTPSFNGDVFFFGKKNIGFAPTLKVSNHEVSDQLVYNPAIFYFELPNS